MFYLKKIPRLNYIQNMKKYRNFENFILSKKFI